MLFLIYIGFIVVILAGRVVCLLLLLPETETERNAINQQELPEILIELENNPRRD